MTKSLQTLKETLLTYCTFYTPTEPLEVFESIFSRVPWTAIPFSDLASRKRIARRFGISEIGFNYTTSVLLSANGVVLKCNECWLFGEYGTLGYPFTDEKIKFLKSEDDAAIKQPSLELQEHFNFIIESSFHNLYTTPIHVFCLQNLLNSD